MRHVARVVDGHARTITRTTPGTVYMYSVALYPAGRRLMNDDTQTVCTVTSVHVNIYTEKPHRCSLSKARWCGAVGRRLASRAVAAPGGRVGGIDGVSHRWWACGDAQSALQLASTQQPDHDHMMVNLYLY